MTRGENIKLEIQEKLATARTTEILGQRKRVEEAIQLETKRVYEAAEHLKPDEFEPIFRAKLNESSIILNEVRTEYEKDGFEFKQEHGVWYVYLAD